MRSHKSIFIKAHPFEICTIFFIHLLLELARKFRVHACSDSACISRLKATMCHCSVYRYAIVRETRCLIFLRFVCYCNRVL